jgi:hypothetical protein
MFSVEANAGIDIHIANIIRAASTKTEYFGLRDRANFALHNPGITTTEPIKMKNSVAYAKILLNNAQLDLTASIPNPCNTALPLDAGLKNSPRLLDIWLPKERMLSKAPELEVKTYQANIMLPKNRRMDKDRPLNLFLVK